MQIFTPTTADKVGKQIFLRILSVFALIWTFNIKNYSQGLNFTFLSFLLPEKFNKVHMGGGGGDPPPPPCNSAG